MRSKQNRTVGSSTTFSTQINILQNSPTHPKMSKQIIINHCKSISTHHLKHLDSPPIQLKQTDLSYLQCASSLGSTSAPPCFEVGHPAALPGPLSKALRTMRCNSNSWQSSKLVFREWDGWFCKNVRGQDDLSNSNK